MSYRLITRAILTITSAAGVASSRELDVRAFPSPKRDPSGAIAVNGVDAQYKRTGGKGRGTTDRRYAYFPLGTESAYIEITEAEAQAMVGGVVAIASVAKQAPTSVADVLETVSADILAVTEPEAPAPTLSRKARRRLGMGEPA